MELRAYTKILWRRLWIVALVMGVVILYIGYDYFSSTTIFETAKTYQAAVSLRIGLPATAHIQDSTEYTQITENLADELTTGPLLADSTFNSQVIQQIKNDKSAISDQFGANANLGDITAEKLLSAYKARRVHNVVTITVTWNTDAGAWAIAYAVGQVCESSLPTYMNYKVAGPDGQAGNDAGNLAAVAKVIGEPDKPLASGGNVVVQRKTTTLIIVFLAGLIMAIALAFLVEYLDDRIHEPSEVMQTLQLPMYGEVPRAPVPGQALPQGKADV